MSECQIFLTGFVKQKILHMLHSSLFVKKAQPAWLFFLSGKNNFMSAQAEVNGLSKLQGCGKALFDFRSNVEDRLPWLGSTRSYLEGRTLGLDAKTKLGYQNINAETLMSYLFIPVEDIYPNDKRVGDRIKTVVQEWASFEQGRKEELYNAFATFDLRKFSEALQWTWSQSVDFDFDLRTVFSLAFTEEDHINHLEGYKASFARPTETDMTAVDRIVFCLYWQQDRKLQRDHKAAGDKLEDRTRIYKTLVPFVTSPSTSVATKKYGSTIMLRSTPEALDVYMQEVPLAAWWYGMLSSDSSIEERVESQMRHILDSSGTDYLDTLVDLAEQTPVDHDNQYIWYKLRDVLSSLQMKPGARLDGLFGIMAKKLSIPENIEERPHPSSSGPVCACLEKILSYSEEDERLSEIVPLEVARNLVAVILELYLTSESNADNWTDRTWMLNLAEKLAFYYPQIAADDSVRSLILRVNQQPEENFAPYDDFMRERAEMSEKEAAQSLLSISIISEAREHPIIVFMADRKAEYAERLSNVQAVVDNLPDILEKIERELLFVLDHTEERRIGDEIKRMHVLLITLRKLALIPRDIPQGVQGKDIYKKLYFALRHMLKTIPVVPEELPRVNPERAYHDLYLEMMQAELAPAFGVTFQR